MQINQCDTSQPNKERQKKHKIISVDSEKAFYLIQYLFVIKKTKTKTKTLTKLGIDRMYPTSYQLLRQTHSQYDTQLWKAESLPAKTSNKRSIPTLIMSKKNKHNISKL